ncbi:hypothetical protein C8F04DRAFT_1075946 [Mycena alexandri]|uniref:Uncharacterized protein n=1 Tax=Mycena alexandri TaxID=1745969 RepID=A0AAD6TEG0_9AGAR|nr:hypothetical protein C8F04DRAFT_1075946 [Mycena alexandri]
MGSSPITILTSCAMVLELLGLRSFLGRRSVFYLIAVVAVLSHTVAAQTLLGGQTFTNGLAVIDSPSPNNPGHAGSSLSIAIDVSGDGQLSAAASQPNSGLPTSYESLEIYLVSAQTNINMTVSSGPALLTSQSGSTVKHLNWPIPACIPAGNYNLTFYESSQYQGQGVFAITSIPIPVSNSNPSAPCSALNAVQPQPQVANPLIASPFMPGSVLTMSTMVGVSSAAAAPSSGTTPASTVTVISASATSDFLTLTLTLSDGVLNLPTVTVTASASASTVVVVSMDTVTETDQGIVTTYTQRSTFTTVVTARPTTANSDNSSGFIPVNAGPRLTSSTPLCLLLGAWTLSSVLLYSRMI